MKTRIYLALTLTVCLLSACEKYVNIKRNSVETLLSSAKDCQSLLDDYSTMNTDYTSDMEISSDDYFLTNNSYSTNGDIGQDEKDLYAWLPSAIHTGDGGWTKLYYIVYRANLVLETVEKLKDNESDQNLLNNLRGSALFFRAFAFWNIAQMYAKPYSATANSDLGIPLRLSSDINDKSVRGTVADTYNRIVTDLQEAVSLLQPTSLKASRPNKAGAHAMLARVYLSMDDYVNALPNATSAIQLAAKNDVKQLDSKLLDYNLLDKSSETPFKRFNGEVIFHAISGSTAILYPGSADSPVARIKEELSNLYEVNDLRKQIFFKPNTISFIYPTPTPSNPTATATATVPDGTYRFTGNYEETAGSDQFIGLAVDEVYLIRAESYARSGNVSSAMNDLNTLLRSRWDNTVTYPVMTASTADEALNKVLNERRKELVMRRQRWTELRRLNKESRFAKTITREVKQFNATGTSPTNYTVTSSVITSFSLPPNDLRYVLLIPQNVITQSGIAQNPR